MINIILNIYIGKAPGVRYHDISMSSCLTMTVCVRLLAGAEGRSKRPGRISWYPLLPLLSYTQTVQKDTVTASYPTWTSSSLQQPLSSHTTQLGHHGFHLVPSQPRCVDKVLSKIILSDINPGVLEGVDSTSQPGWLTAWSFLCLFFNHIYI